MLIWAAAGLYLVLLSGYFDSPKESAELLSLVSAKLKSYGTDNAHQDDLLNQKQKRMDQLNKQLEGRIAGWNRFDELTDMVDYQLSREISNLNDMMRQFTAIELKLHMPAELVYARCHIIQNVPREHAAWEHEKPDTAHCDISGRGERLRKLVAFTSCVTDHRARARCWCHSIIDRPRFIRVHLRPQRQSLGHPRLHPPPVRVLRWIIQYVFPAAPACPIVLRQGIER